MANETYTYPQTPTTNEKIAANYTKIETYMYNIQEEIIDTNAGTFDTWHISVKPIETKTTSYEVKLNGDHTYLSTNTTYNSEGNGTHSMKYSSSTGFSQEYAYLDQLNQYLSSFG